MLKISRHEMIHILTYNPEFDITTLLLDLHKARIPTLQVNNAQAFKSIFADTKPKTMLFMLYDLSNILNLILGSQNFGKEAFTTIPPNSSVTCPLNSKGKQQPFSLPNFCINHGVVPNFTLMDPTRPCDEKLTIPDTHLQESSILSDEAFKHVRGLYLNNVWNSRSHLVFYLGSGSNSLETEDSINSMRFVFKFMWRTFKGQRTLICSGLECYRYDPFFEEIQRYEPGNHERFFDFSWRSMNGKTFTFMIVENPLFDCDSALQDDCTRNNVIYHAIGWLVLSRNGTLNSLPPQLEGFINAISPSDPGRLEYGLKYGVDMHFTGSGAGLANRQGLDASPPLASCQLVFRLPRKGYVPPYVTPFYCFSPSLWIFVFLTFLLFTLVHYALVRARGRLFEPSNDEEAKDHELFPTLMTIYKYILGISQPRLVLIEMMTGKIVFLVIVFSMLILITLFQSMMFSLLSSRVRYEDIDTLEGIEESDMVVQSSDIEMDVRFFGDEPGFDWIKRRLTDGYNFKCPLENMLELGPIDFDPFNPGGKLADINETSDFDLTPVDTNETRLARREVGTMLKSDAFLYRMTTKYADLKDFVYLDLETRTPYEFHIARERVMSYPLVYFTLRNSFYSDAVNDLLSRLLEGGGFSADVIGQYIVLDHKRFEERENDGAPRPFTFTDLMLAFDALVAGWVLSGFFFVSELLRQF